MSPVRRSKETSSNTNLVAFGDASLIPELDPGLSAALLGLPELANLRAHAMLEEVVNNIGLLQSDEGVTTTAFIILPWRSLVEHAVQTLIHNVLKPYV